MSASSYTTRSGRAIKKPILYEPQERPEDDFKEHEYDSSGDSDGSDCEESDEGEETDDEEDADEDGNLKGFVVEDSSEDEEDD